MRERVEGDQGGTVTQLASEARAQLMGRRKGESQREQVEAGRSDEEERLRAMRGKMGPRGDA